VTSNERSADRWERLRPRNWSLAFKLVAVLVVPVLLAQALLVLRIVEQVNEADRLGGNDRYVETQDRVSTLVGQAQRERDESVRFVADGRVGDRSAQKTVFGATDGSAEEARTAIGPASLGGAAEAYRLAQEALGKLPALRTQVTDSQAPVADVLTQYSAIVAPLIRLESAIGGELRLAEPTSLPAALQSLGVVGEQIALQHAVISAAIIRKQISPQEADLVRAADVRLASTVDELNATLNADQRARLAGFVSSPDNTKREQLKNAVLSRAASTPTDSNTTTRTPAPLPPLAEWDAAHEGVLTALEGAEEGARTDLRTLSAAQQENAKNLAGIYSVILLLATVLGTTLLVLVWRTLLKSLRTLRGTALDVAQRKLPQALQSMREGEVPEISVEPVPVTTSEEIGQVARAFDAVHSQAVRLAAEQATLQAGVSSMFVNLSRRSQGLVERQLQLIEQLESNEQDPDQLANLFQLDHLATRMRRNSESLLVLAGSEANRRAGQPVPVIDVLRAAVSEVEQYQRIVVQPPPRVKILGRTAADLVHLLAELLDNATNFSAPDTQVVMSSTRTEDGSVLIEIADRGVGMAPNEMAEANDRLSGPTTVDVSASRRMGLFVVGRLASRHGIGVRLGGPPTGTAAAGVTASVSVPSYLVPVVEGAGTAIGDGARVGAGAPVPQEQMAGNGASMPGSLQALVASGNSRPGPNGVANGHGAPVRPDLPPQRAPMDRPLAPPRLGPPLAPPNSSPQGLPQGLPPGLPQGMPQNPDPGRAPTGSGQWNGPAVPAAPMAGRATETAPPRQDRSRPEQNPTGERPMYGGPPPGGPGDQGMRSAQETAAPPMQHPQHPGSPPRTMPPGGGTLFAPSVPAMAEPPAAAAPSPAPAQAPSTPPPPPPPPPSRPSAPPLVPRRPVEAAVTERRDLSETTPIFEEIASAWFQSNRPVPVDWDTVDGEADGETGGETGGEQDQAEQHAAARVATPTLEPQVPPLSRPPAGSADAEADTGEATPREPQASQGPAPSAPSPTLDPRLRVTSSLRSYVPEPVRQPEPAAAQQPEAAEAAHESVPEPVAQLDPDREPDREPSPEAQRPPEPEVAEQPEPEPEPEPESESESESESEPIAQQAPAPAQPVAAPLPTRQPAAALQSQLQQAPERAVPEPVAEAPSSLEFASAADAGWQAAQALDSGAKDEPEELTAAGLPKRKPRARLIPSSASAAAAPTQAGAPPRTADAVRGRLASYQEGVRQGREQRLRRGPDHAGATTGGRPSEGHDEENR